MAFVAVYLIWGSTFGAIAVAIAEVPPFMLAAVRWLIAGGLLYAFLRARGVRPPSAAEWKRGLFSGAFLILAGNGLVCWAEKSMSSGSVATLLAVSPMLVVLFDWSLFGARRPALRTWAGLVAGFAGVIMLVGPTVSEDLAAVLAVLLAGAAWALGSLYNRRTPRSSSPAMSSATQMLGGGALLAVTSGALGEPMPTSLSFETGLAVGYLVVFGSLVGFGAYMYLVRRVRPSAVATHAFVNPMVAVVIGWAWLGERVDQHTLLAAGLILIAVALIVSPERRPRRARPKPFEPGTGATRSHGHA